MSNYSLTWISGNLAVGSAPLSYDDLEAIRENGINVIVNLCGEYCDLHDIERSSGFEVLYLPIHDDSAPGLEELDRALAWLDEALYLGKKALVHCRLGVGRTGTFITAYLLRRGFGLKRAEAAMKNIRSAPSSDSQWHLLRKYRKSSGKLTISEPTLDMKSVVELGPFFAEYERIVEEFGRNRERASAAGAASAQCDREHDACCHTPLLLTLAEAAYLNYRLNRGLTQTKRSEAIARALLKGGMVRAQGNAAHSGQDEHPRYAQQDYTCPLSVDRTCIAFEFRPIACRVSGWETAGTIGPGPISEATFGHMQASLRDLSQRLFFALNASCASDASGKTAVFRLADVVSGRFIQQYFDLLAKGMKDRG